MMETELNNLSDLEKLLFVQLYVSYGPPNPNSIEHEGNETLKRTMKLVRLVLGHIKLFRAAIKD